MPVDRFFFDPITKGALVDTVLSLTGFALVGGSARQDHPKAIESLKKLDVPYMVTVPLSFQTTEEWKDSTPSFAPRASRVASRASGVGRWFGTDHLFRQRLQVW